MEIFILLTELQQLLFEMENVVFGVIQEKTLIVAPFCSIASTVDAKQNPFSLFTPVIQRRHQWSLGFINFIEIQIDIEMDRIRWNTHFLCKDIKLLSCLDDLGLVFEATTSVSLSKIAKVSVNIYACKL